MRLFVLILALAVPLEAKPEAQVGLKPSDEPLKLLISIEQQTITAPFPARVTLHLHNSGPRAAWLYRRARSPEAARRAEVPRVEQAENAGSFTTGGSLLTARLEPAELPASPPGSTPAEGVVLESVGLPHPKLFKLKADDDYEEKTVVRLTPALVAPDRPRWGRYRLAVTYSARYSNAAEIARNLGVEIWQGEVMSNVVELELRPALRTAPGSVSGTVVSPNQHPLPDALVSLSDEQERVVDQRLTGGEGRFSFTGLPLGLYWATARLENSPSDTVIFRHVELTPDQPAGSAELIVAFGEIYEPKGLLHKPVLFRVTDSAGRPLDRVTLESTWSSGTVLDNVRGEAADDGAVALELIPGRNFVTLKRHGCAKQDQRVDVAGGDGIDDFALVLECGRQ